LEVPDGRAFVALDPRDGKVLAIGSAPTFDPAERARPIATQAEYERRFGEEPGPRFSTARSAAATPSARSSSRSPPWRRWMPAWPRRHPVNDPGFLKVGEQTFTNAGRQANGTVLRRALQVSSDVDFYTLGRDANPVEGQGNPELGPEAGLRPAHGDRPARRGAGHDSRPRLEGTPEPAADRLGEEERQELPARLLYSDKRPCWSAISIQLSVGQGNVEAPPGRSSWLAYAALANGGLGGRGRTGRRRGDGHRPPGRVDRKHAGRGS
jgi:penicillin-binding protein 2